MYAVQAMPATINIWQIPKATRGEKELRLRNAPTLLPIPNPHRNTARMMENV